VTGRIGEYEITSRLSEGGMATLFLGRKAGAAPTDPPVAIKVIHEHLSEDWQFVRMFIDEALISVRLRHPNVVRVDELGEDDNVYFLAMEYVHGCSLAELLRAMGRRGRRMRPEIAVWIAAQVASGLHAAHEMVGHDGQLLGVVHRDVSPQNVLLSVDGEVKLLDFGIAKAKGRAERTEAGVIKGKVRYMSPEQAAGHDFDRRVDIYALGVVLWEMLTMRRYIEGKNDVEIFRRVRKPDLVPPSFRAEGIDPRIDDAVMAALAPAEARRPPTAEAFRRLLEGAVPEGTVGPAHVAELLRVFVGEKVERAARALPGGVGNAYAERVRAPTPLPGEDVSPDDVTRTRTLTAPAPRIELGGEDEPTKQAAALEGETREVGLPDLEEIDPFDAPTDQELPGRELPRFGADDDDDETVQASGEELADFFDRMKADAGASGEARPSAPDEWRPDAPPTRPGGSRGQPVDAAAGLAPAYVPPAAAGAAAPEPAPIAQQSTAAPDPFAAAAPPRAPAPTPEGSTAMRWVLGVLLLTVVAFAVGAGAAVAWVELIR
jgi:serine/threonine-protein kinase